MLLLVSMANRTDKKWKREVRELFGRAAQLSVEHDLDLDTFVRQAYAAYFAVSPGLQEEIVEQQLVDQLEELRRAGRIAQA
jgi:hypothetical protein